MTDHRSPAESGTGNPMSQRAADVLSWALGRPLTDPAPEPSAPVEPATPPVAAEERPQTERQAPAEPEPQPEAPEEAEAVLTPTAAEVEPESADQHSADQAIPQGHPAEERPGPAPVAVPVPVGDARERIRKTRTRLHRLAALERRQSAELARTRELITAAQADLLALAGELATSADEQHQAAPEPAAPTTETEQDTAPDRAADDGAQEAADDGTPVLRVLNNEAATTDPQFGPHGPFTGALTGNERADWMATWLGRAPAARYRVELLIEDGWQRAPLTDPDGETSAWTVARTLATLRGGTPVQWAADGTVSAPRLRWVPVADCRPVPAGTRVDLAREFTGATAPLAAPDSAWSPEPGTADADALSRSLRELPEHVDASVSGGVLKIYAPTGVYRFTPRT